MQAKNWYKYRGSAYLQTASRRGRKRLESGRWDVSDGKRQEALRKESAEDLFFLGACKSYYILGLQQYL